MGGVNRRRVRATDRRSTENRFRMASVVPDGLKGGRILMKEKREYEGFFTRPLSWEKAVKKFNSLCPPAMDTMLQEKIITAVADLERIRTADLMKLLGKIVPKKQR